MRVALSTATHVTSIWLVKKALEILGVYVSTIHLPFCRIQLWEDALTYFRWWVFGHRDLVTLLALRSQALAYFHYPDLTSPDVSCSASSIGHKERRQWNRTLWQPVQWKTVIFRKAESSTRTWKVQTFEFSENWSCRMRIQVSTIWTFSGCYRELWPNTVSIWSLAPLIIPRRRIPGYSSPLKKWQQLRFYASHSDDRFTTALLESTIHDDPGGNTLHNHWYSDHREQLMWKNNSPNQAVAAFARLGFRYTHDLIFEGLANLALECPSALPSMITEPRPQQNYKEFWSQGHQRYGRENARSWTSPHKQRGFTHIGKRAILMTGPG